ncbi:MAG: type VI secretion system contractile sheath small subunit [Phycisphaerae bacterium]|jgi:type VI secretion system protein ImpB
MADQSKAPKERINITYRPATNTKEQKELPFRMAMLGDFTLKPDDTPLEERKTIRVDKDNFNDVMKSQDLGTTINVANKLSGEEGAEMGVQLKFSTLKDFEPEQIARQVPELNQLLQTREALNALKAPLANKRAFQKRIAEIVQDEATRQKLMEIFQQTAGSGEEGSAPAPDAGGGEGGEGGAQ